MATEVAIGDLGSWLASQPTNTPETAYEIKITGLTSSNINSIRTILYTYNNRYVDLSATELPSVYSLSEVFANCGTLVKSPKLPEEVINLSRAFSYCINLIQAPIIPNNVKNMYATFSECKALTEPPVLPQSVENAQLCFSGSSILSAPEIPFGITDVIGMFSGCKALTEPPIVPSSVKNMKQFVSGCKSLTDIPIIPDGVTSLYESFAGLNIVSTERKIPNSVLNMSRTFYGCKNLVNAPTIPENVTSLVSCFYGCTALVSVPKIQSKKNIDMGGCFSGCTSLVTAPVIPETATSIGSCFSGCTSLVTAPVILRNETSPNLVMIQAFKNCTSLVTVPNIPNNVTSLDSAFYGCSALEEIELWECGNPKKDWNAENAFYGCTSLTKIGIPREVPEESDDWHVMSLKIGASTVEGKIYDRDGNDTEINGGTPVSITKDSLILPVYTDELMFPPSSMSDADLEALILKVLQYKYTWFKKETIDPENKSFVLWADDPANFKSNVTMDMPVYPTLSALEADLPNLSDGQLVAYEQGGDGLVDAVTNGDMRGVTSNAVFDFVSAKIKKYSVTQTITARTMANGESAYVDFPIPTNKFIVGKVAFYNLPVNQMNCFYNDFSGVYEAYENSDNRQKVTLITIGTPIQATLHVGIKNYTGGNVTIGDVAIVFTYLEFDV